MLAFTLPLNPWLYILVFGLILCGSILLLSAVTSLIIAKAAAKYSDKTIGKYQEALEAMLPGTDCGQCKCKTCASFADKVLHTEIDETRCPFLDEKTQLKMLDLREKLQKLMEDPTPPKKNEPRFWEQKF